MVRLKGLYMHISKREFFRSDFWSFWIEFSLPSILTSGSGFLHLLWCELLILKTNMLCLIYLFILNAILPEDMSPKTKKDITHQLLKSQTTTTKALSPQNLSLSSKWCWIVRVSICPGWWLPCYISDLSTYSLNRTSSCCFSFLKRLKRKGCVVCSCGCPGRRTTLSTRRTTRPPNPQEL